MFCGLDEPLERLSWLWDGHFLYSATENSDRNLHPDSLLTRHILDLTSHDLTSRYPDFRS
jgi:hypothetical protein